MDENIKDIIQNCLYNDDFYAYDQVREILYDRPDLAPDILTIVQEYLKSDKNDSVSFRIAYETFREIVGARPDLAPDILTTVQECLKSDKNDSVSFRIAYGTFREIVEARPDLAPDILTTVQEYLKSDKNNSFSFWGAYGLFEEMVKTRPDLAPDILTTVQECLKSDKNDSASFRTAYETFREIVGARPDLAPDILTTFQEYLKSDKNNGYGIVYETLGKIVETRPDLAPDILTTFQECLKSDKNDSVSFRIAYGTFREIVEARPDLAPDILTTVQEYLKSDKNNSFSFRGAYRLFEEMVKTRPDLAPDILTTVQKCLKSDKNNSDSFLEAYELLGKIVEIKPELIDSAIKGVLDAKSQTKETLSFLAKCMKKRQSYDISGISDEQRKLLLAAYNMRYSLQDEIYYCYDRLGIDKISQMRFSAQQRCLNVMMGQLGKEQKLPAEDVNQYRKDANNTTYQSNKDWLLPASFNAAEIFGCYFPAYIKSTEKHLSTHDAVYWLPKDLPENKRESFRSFVQRNLIYDDTNGQRKARPLAEMEIISKNWKYLKPEDEKLKYKDILAICQSRKYLEQEYDKFAAEAAKWGVSESEYKNWEGVYQAGLNVPEPFDSSKEFKFGKYTGKFLPREDVRTGFFGGYTDCCQHFDGVGSTCAISTVKDPYSQLFVIENQEGRIIAGSWVWENTEGKYRNVCFDNIEAIGEYAQNPLVNKIYDMVGEYLTTEANCHKVTIGLGYQDADVSKYKETKAVPLPTQYNDKYSDAKRTQVLLAENSKAKPIDKSQESVRFIRDVCFLDIDDMDKVSEQCFPRGDEMLYVPDPLSGLALVDKEKGIVGYCLYNKEDKHIYDMAVLPEYRKDKNASSRKLFGELIRRIKDIGGEWQAELRDKTTYKYLEIMSERGLVDFKNHGIYNEMKDGSKVYKVSFSVKSSREEASKNNILIHNMLKNQQGR